jgi:PII-like signaling protein
MWTKAERTLLRIFLGEDDRAADGKQLFEAVVLRAREQGLAGATVLRGPMGFGQASRLHTAKILRLSDKLPIVVEIVDETEKIERFIGILQPMIGGSVLVTLEKVQVVRYEK